MKLLQIIGAGFDSRSTTYQIFLQLPDIGEEMGLQ
jgi:hypothetical protein